MFCGRLLDTVLGGANSYWSRLVYSGPGERREKLSVTFSAEVVGATVYKKILGQSDDWLAGYIPPVLNRFYLKVAPLIGAVLLGLSGVYYVLCHVLFI